ncbi:MAG: hypothetical protein LBL05_07635 [Synergistaceae bacterium]|nr:hypothetical protein [Synergistaceae bacterium]
MSNMSDRGVESHIKRVERWLKRCVAACRCGSWSDALSEAECLEAETKGLCEKLWRAAGDEAAGAEKIKVGAFVFSLLKVSTLAMAMVLTAVLPISTDTGPILRDAAYAPMSFELLTSEESDIIDALRASLSSGNRGAAVLTAETPKKTVPAAETKSGAAMAAEAVPAPAEAVASVQADEVIIADSPRRPSADEVISLIQVGQRALRASEPGIKIEL